MVGDGSDQVHELITDLMHGRAFIRMDKKGFAKYIDMKTGVPTERRYKESGDRIFRWKGNEFNEQDNLKNIINNMVISLVLLNM